MSTQGYDYNNDNADQNLMAYVVKEALQETLSNLTNLEYDIKEALMYHGCGFTFLIHNSNKCQE